MGTVQVVVIVLVAWIALGVGAALVMGRRGHSAVTWFALAVAFGPFAIPLAIRSAREGERVSVRRAESAGSIGGGTVDVLVGIDGSPASEAALRTVEAALGPAIRRLTIAAVIDFDSAQSQSAWDDEIRAEEELRRLADSVTICRPATTILAGRPAECLVAHAAREGYGLLAIGRRGRGASKALLGSVADRLSAGAEVPVLIV